MSRAIARSIGMLVLLSAAAALAGCGKFGSGASPPQSTELPTARQLRRIAYMSQADGPGGRRIFNHLEQAKSCRDLEIAMRWNRPPDVASGPFAQKMVYLTAAPAASLPPQSEVFVTGVIERGESLSSGSSGWSLRMKDGSEIQAIEPVEYWQREEQLQQQGGSAAIVNPYTPGRAFCAYGVYEGVKGMSLKGDRHVPLVSVLFAMDRRK